MPYTASYSVLCECMVYLNNRLNWCRSPVEEFCATLIQTYCTMRSVADDEGLERNLNFIPSEITKIIEFKVVNALYCELQRSM